MVDAKDAVSVLLTSESRITSSRYEVIIGSTKSKLRRIKGGSSEDLLVKNITEPLKENEMRSFWIEVETDRVVFGSGEKVIRSFKASDVSSPAAPKLSGSNAGIGRGGGKGEGGRGGGGRRAWSKSIRPLLCAGEVVKLVVNETLMRQDIQRVVSSKAVR